MGGDTLELGSGPCLPHPLPYSVLALWLPLMSPLCLLLPGPSPPAWSLSFLHLLSWLPSSPASLALYCLSLSHPSSVLTLSYSLIHLFPSICPPPLQVSPQSASQAAPTSGPTEAFRAPSSVSCSVVLQGHCPYPDLAQSAQIT